MKKENSAGFVGETIDPKPAPEVEVERPLDPGIPPAPEGEEFDLPTHLEWESVTDPQYVDEDKTLIKCKVVFPSIQAEPMPFVAAQEDTAEHSKLIFQEIIDGKWGKIKPMCMATERKRVESGALANRTAFMTSTDWLVSRHRDEKELGGPTSITDNQYLELQAYRRALRDWPDSPEFPNGYPVAPDWLK